MKKRKRKIIEIIGNMYLRVKKYKIINEIA